MSTPQRDRHFDCYALLDAILRAQPTVYLRTDAALIIQEVTGTSPLLPPATVLGASLYGIFPELIGAEESLAALQSGAADSYTLGLINREDAAGALGYFNLTLVAAPEPSSPQAADSPAELIALWEDITETGTIRQKVMQQRNELTLLRNQLAAQNVLLEDANLELRRMNQLKSKFIGVAAHELRSPLTSVLGYTELLQNEDFGTLNPRQRRFAEVVETSAHRLLSLLNNMLDLTRIEVGNLELRLEPNEIAGLVQESCAELLLHFEQKQQLLRFTPPAHPVTVLCDDRRVVQVLINLLSNAHKYTPENGVIDVTITVDAASGFAEVAVTDNGIGIPQEELNSLFVSFYRATNAGESQAGGAGLGLNIAKSLIEQHGGEMRVKSAYHEGATFSFTLPLAEIEPTNRRSRQPESHG